MSLSFTAEPHMYLSTKSISVCPLVHCSPSQNQNGSVGDCQVLIFCRADLLLRSNEGSVLSSNKPVTYVIDIITPNSWLSNYFYQHDVSIHKLSELSLLQLHICPKGQITVIYTHVIRWNCSVFYYSCCCECFTSFVFNRVTVTLEDIKRQINNSSSCFFMQIWRVKMHFHRSTDDTSVFLLCDWWTGGNSQTPDILISLHLEGGLFVFTTGFGGSWGGEGRIDLSFCYFCLHL